MADVLLSGTVTGVGTVPTLNPIKIAVMAGLASGAGDLICLTFNRLIMFGGQAHGYGDISDHLSVLMDGTVTGQGSTSGTLFRVLPLRGSSLGIGTLLESILLPAVGLGSLMGFMDVGRVPCPVSCTPVMPTFSWGQQFGPGELMISFTDAVGNPWAPVVVLFRMFRVVRGGTLYPVGPFNRRPVACQRRLGVYYVVGMAGEGGQPGEWVIEWRWQRSPYDPPTVERRPFKVLDAVAAGDLACRCVKYGWD